KENEYDSFKTQNKISEIRLVDRAKCILIQHLEMTEQQAHHYIEKSAMDNCVSKRKTAENIIKLYS
ncbi:MAG: ANTAR domain-containing protein, partial [Oscillospiraceae bacterium]|nr:ANTAR domain-containing protein [Oscillospiraceae bacterium]